MTLSVRLGHPWTTNDIDDRKWAQALGTSWPISEYRIRQVIANAG